VPIIGDGFVPLGGWTARGFFDLTVGKEDGTMMIEAPRAEDFAEWARLYAGYAAFYGVEQTDEMRARVWGWIGDAGHPVQALVARDGAGLIGLAHFRPFSRPLSATTGGYLDDLFVDPAVRGTGAGRLLIAGVKAAGRAQGWSVIRWITAQDNARARGLYDAVAQETKWVTYDLKL
jgi:GNAT superfamily N-acetyltransferase